MSIFGVLVSYIVIWWIVLFMVLPWKVQSQAEIDSSQAVLGTDPGAPIKANMWKKILVTSVISSVLWGFFFWLFYSNIISFRDLIYTP